MMRRRGFVCALVIGIALLAALALRTANAGWVYGPNGPQWQPDPAPSMPYPYFNPVAVNTNPTPTGTPVYNPYTGQYLYNTESATIYQSAFQPGRNTLMPGTSAQYVNQGGQQGWSWTDAYGNPHFSGTISQQTPFGNHTTHLYYASNPNASRRP